MIVLSIIKVKRYSIQTLPIIYRFAEFPPFLSDYYN